MLPNFCVPTARHMDSTAVCKGGSSADVCMFEVGSEKGVVFASVLLSVIDRCSATLDGARRSEECAHRLQCLGEEQGKNSVKVNEVEVIDPLIGVPCFPRPCTFWERLSASHGVI